MSVGKKIIESASGVGGGGVSDDDFANVVLLLDGDGTSGDDNNTFTDSSTNSLTASPDGTVVQGSFSPYGDNWSNYFDGSGDYLTVSANSFNTGGTWTIECWALWNNPNTGGNISATLINGLASDKLYFGFYNNVIYIGDNSTNNIAHSYTPEVGRWYHYALVKNGSTYTLYIDGTSVATSTTQLSTVTLTSWQIGGRSAQSSYWDGYISNMRVVNGTAVYTSDFTPSTSPLTAITNTSFLGCQSNRFKDNSTNNFSSTISGTPKVSPFSPFKNDEARTLTADGGSAYFDGGDHDIQWGASGDLALGSGDWSVETWFYMNALPTYVVGGFIDWRTFGSSPTNVPVANVTLAGNVVWYGSVGSGVAMTSNIPLKVGEWTHIAFAKSGSTTTMYFNGTSVASFSDSRTYAAQVFGMGNIQTQYGIDSYYSDLRILVGTTAYTGSFTPPTAPLTAVTNTELLASFQDAGIYDRSGINNIDTVGNAQIDTAVKKYGTGSMQFDGSGDYLKIPHSEELNFGTGDFTIEMWVSLSSGTQDNDGIIAKGETGTGWQLIWNNTNEILFIRTNGSASSPQLSSGSNTVNKDGTWYHVAVTRSGSTVRMFLDGTQVDTYTDSTSWDTTDFLGIGANRSENNLMTGYIDDLRITKGVARYTSNFTAPTEELPKF